MSFRTTRPAADEYGAYYHGYIQQIPAGHDPIAQLRTQQTALHALFSGLTDEQALLRYAPGKWSIKETLVHVIDTERVFAYRAMRVGRGDTTPLPGFDQDAFAVAAEADARPLADLLREYDAQRAATLALLESFSAPMLERRGTASDVPISVRALSFIIPGHEAHHLQLWRERVWPLLTPAK